MMLLGNAASLPVTQPAHRLSAGLVLSVVLHALLVFGVSPTTRPRVVPAVPLLVEIQRVEAPQPAAEIAAEPPSDWSAVASASAPPESPPTEDMPPPAAAPEAPVTISLPLDKYFTARELDVRAEPVNEVDLVYPVKAYEMRMNGRVVVRILINEHGAVDSVSVLEATPPGVFEEAALEATQALLFRPAQKHGRNVKSQKTVEVTFDPYESIRPR